MQRKYKIAIILLLILSIVMSLFLLTLDSGHKCHNEDGFKCTVCMLVGDIAKCLIQLCIVILLSKMIQNVLCAFKKELNLSTNNTLFNQKVKLSD